MTKNLIMVLRTDEEFLATKDKLNGPFESIIEKSKLFHFSVVDTSTQEAYGKTLDLVKNTARRLECDAVYVKYVHFDVGLAAVTTTIEADLYRTK